MELSAQTTLSVLELYEEKNSAVVEGESYWRWIFSTQRCREEVHYESTPTQPAGSSVDQHAELCYPLAYRITVYAMFAILLVSLIVNVAFIVWCCRRVTRKKKRGNLRAILRGAVRRRANVEPEMIVVEGQPPPICNGDISTIEAEIGFSSGESSYKPMQSLPEDVEAGGKARLVPREAGSGMVWTKLLAGLNSKYLFHEKFDDDSSQAGPSVIDGSKDEWQEQKMMQVEEGKILGL